jgi:hypothetical protein
MPGTRRQKQQQQQQQDGGRRRRMRKTRKASAGSWPQFVKKTYMQMKKKDKSATFKQAMKEASRLKKAGQF